jgi:hypothetical protein
LVPNIPEIVKKWQALNPPAVSIHIFISPL